MAALKKKDDDMRAMEDRYKMYLEKARNVITHRYTQTDDYVFTCVEKTRMRFVKITFTCEFLTFQSVQHLNH